MRICDLIVLEQFKSSLLARLATYINERTVRTASVAAVLADECFNPCKWVSI